MRRAGVAVTFLVRSLHLRVVLLLVTVFTTAAFGQEAIYIVPIKNTDRDAVDAVSAECTLSADRHTLTCDFTQTSVGQKVKPSEIGQRLDEEIGRLQKESSGKSIPQEFEDIRKSTMCRPADGDVARLEKKAREADLSDAYKRFMLGYVERMRRFCERPSLETFRALHRYSLEQESRTCRVWSNPYRETFTLQAPGKWVSNRGPSGWCGVIHISTLEQHDKDKPPEQNLLWTYETRKVVTGDKSNQICQIWREQPAKYAWNASDKTLSCEFIEFGF